MKPKYILFRYPMFGLILLLQIINLNCNAVNKNPELSIVTDEAPDVVVSYGLAKLTDALVARNIAVEKVHSIDEARGNWVIVAGLAYNDGVASQMLKAGNRNVPKVPEALTIWKTEMQTKPVWVISGFDDRGLMYALLDVADRIGWSKNPQFPMSEVQEVTEQPDTRERSVSIYTMNRAYWESRFYDEVYWKRYLDVLAQNRFNSVVVIFGYENGGFLAPCYPYFFNVEEFPEVSMASIKPEEQQRNLDALNNLIKMAHERGIRFSVGIWDHIYRGGVQRGGISDEEEAAGKFELSRVTGVNEKNLISYNLSALEKFVKLVPNLDGIQFRMHDESGLKREEQDQFWLNVFQKMKKTNPDLHFDLRAKGLPESVIQSAIKVGVNFRITTKYWMEQMGLPFHPTHINRENQNDRRHSYADMLRYPQQYKMLWRLWTGGTTRILLWGDPEYTRRFIESTHLYDGDGFEINEPLATKMEAQPHDEKPFELLNPDYRYYDYEFERYWHFFQVFGRIGYNPETSPAVWGKEFEKRFGEKTGPLVQEALHEASQVLPRIVASAYPYGCFPTTRGWAEKQRLGDLPEYALGEGSDIQQFASFDEEARLLIEGGETAKILPSSNSQWFKQTAENLNKLIRQAENSVGNNRTKEFNSTITDLKILSNLALFHSLRIPAAVSYRLFVRNHDAAALDDAISYERKALEAWSQIVVSAGDVYTGNLKMGVNEAEFVGIKHHISGHWKDELGYLQKGIAELEMKRINLQGKNTDKNKPRYKEAQYSDTHSLFKIIHQPVTSAPAAKPLPIRIKINSSFGIQWVRLRFRNVNQTEDYQELQMNPTIEKDFYEVIVPAEKVNSKWDFMYFFEVMDKKGNGAIFPDLNRETPYIIVKLIR